MNSSFRQAMRSFSACALIGGSIVAATAAPAAAPVPDGEIRIKYKVAWVGIDIASATFAAKIERGLYTTRVGYRTTGLVRLGVAASGDVTSTGAIDSVRLTPVSFIQSAKENSKEIKVSIGFQGTNVKTSEAIPEQAPNPSRVPIKDENKRNVFDPLTSLVIPTTKGKDGLAAACNHSIPVFDGWSRFDINLSLKSSGEINKAHYKGPSVTCAVRYVPVAGHIPDRPGTKFMAENKDIEVTLIPLGDTGMAVPVHIGLQTLRGHIDVDAVDVSLVKPETPGAN